MAKRTKRAAAMSVREEQSDWPDEEGRVSQSIRDARVEAVLSAAEKCGFLKDKSGRISGRVSPVLVAKAKAETGIETDSELIEYALASLALEDPFLEAFIASRGTVDPDLDLGF